MKKSLVFLAISMIVVSCNKKSDDFIWERSFGQGVAYCVKAASDSGILSCGNVNDFPYLLKLRKDKSAQFEFTSDHQGLFSSVWSDTSVFIAGGSSNGNMLLACVDNDGKKIWDTVMSSPFYIETTGLVYEGDGALVAVGTAMPDSAVSGSSGILFVRFDTTGRIISRKESPEAGFVAAGMVTSDEGGKMFLPLTRMNSGSGPKASVAGYSSEFNKLWETDLYNNPDFSAASRSITIDDAGIIYVTGNTEVIFGDSVLSNSFLVSLSHQGSTIWKKYIERTNTGSALVFDSDGYLMMLNTNCFIVSIVNPEDGSDAGKIRTFDVCNANATDAFGRDIDINYDGNILLAGSRGGNYNLAIKSKLQ